MSIIGRKLRAARLKDKFTREQIAGLLAISVSVYADMEEGRRLLTKEEIEDFVNLLGFKKEDLEKQEAQILEFKKKPTD